MTSTDGTAQIEQILSDGSSFAILVSEKAGSKALTATMTGNLVNDTMKGSTSLNDGTQVIVLTFVGTRVK